MPSPPDVGVLVPAAGLGRRAGDGEPKQFRVVAGVPVLSRALGPFLSHAAVLQVVVALPPSAAAAPPDWLARLIGPRLTVVPGGEERIDSVERALAVLDPAATNVLVHDGARPFPDPAVIDEVIALARDGRAAIAALPVTDTLKEARADPGFGPVAARTVGRDGLWRAQTPQGFPRSLLERALAHARASGLVPTDDAAMVEALGEPVILVTDRGWNLKVTTPADFALAEAIARMAP